MLRFILKRLLAIIPVVLGVLLIVFSVMRMAPGDPAMAALGNRYTEEQYEAKKEELGLDRPFLVQFADYVVGVVTRFDLGTSYKSNRSVNTEILERLPVTLRLGLTGIVITVVLGVPLGILAAVKQYSIGDYIATVLSLIMASMPSFWLGLMLIIIFALRLQWRPAQNIGSFLQSPLACPLWHRYCGLPARPCWMWFGRITFVQHALRACQKRWSSLSMRSAMRCFRSSPLWELCWAELWPVPWLLRAFSPFPAWAPWLPLL